MSERKCDFCNGVGSFTKTFPGVYNSITMQPNQDIIKQYRCERCSGTGTRENKNPKVYTWDEFKDYVRLKKDDPT